MPGSVGPYQTTSGITYFNAIKIAAMVFDPLNDETHVHMASGTIFTMKQSQSEFNAFMKWVSRNIDDHQTHRHLV